MARAGASSSSPPPPPQPPLPLTREAAEEEEEEEEEEDDGEEDGEEEEEEEEDPPARALMPRSSPVPRPQHSSAPESCSSSEDDGEDDGHHQHPCLARPLSEHPPGLPGPPSQHAVQDSRGLPSQHAQGHPGLFSQHATAAATPMEEPSQHTAGRHVLFADALGLPLARWRRYQPWPPPSPESPPEVVPSLASLPPSTSTPYLLPSFVLQPVGQDEDEKLERLHQAKVELEEVLPPEPGEPRVLRGTVRVLNVSYHKAVHVRASKDRWQSHRDYPALYIPGGSPDGGLTDRFAFRLDFGDEDEEDEEEGGARLDFVVRYQTEEGVYWANNQGKNYSVVLKGAAATQVLPTRSSKEGESHRLKSCMRPVKIRSGENELQVEDIAQYIYSEETSVEGNLSKEFPNSSLMQPSTPIKQIPELTITANSPEKKDPSKDHLVDFTDSPQGHAIRVHTTSHEELKVPLGFMLGAEPHPLGQWDAPEFSKCDLTTEGSFMDECMEEQLKRYQELPHRLEEDAIDRELEQLYLSHLSRLRAEELGGRGDWSEESSGNNTSPVPSLIALRQSVLTDRDLIVNWTGPERALNSSLAKEITLYYAKQRGDDSRDSEEEGIMAGYATQGPPEVVGSGRDSPPVLLEGCFLNHLEEGNVQQSPMKDSDSFPSLRVVAPNTLRPVIPEAMVMPLVVPARTLVPLPKRPTDLPSSPLDAPGQGKSQGFLIGHGSLWLGEGLHVHKPPETSPVPHNELEKILTRSLRFLSLFVFLPVVFNSCMPLVAVTLYLLLDWFS
ncbi:protein phosphatase 1 regulatory subunit 3F isoform X2 [Ahaetulla prasina]|uniref:protein phosphatase 1 regulatory subunit 3F isoform X2 n=1 Tax=Ahaetulla prasina TaxID=499056 RepID=UPI002649EAF4|nr:protein phosphatase 1 regulatory subunit 3F isoform X2 [Ahaetulla prasina]